MASSTTHETFCQIAVRAADVEQAERLAAEAYAAGATGLGERERDNEITLILCAPTAAARENARSNGLGERLRLFTGGLEAIIR